VLLALLLPQQSQILLHLCHHCWREFSLRGRLRGQLLH
jgi:hypothetical protein